ncbi:MAG: pyridoxamine 5'-phosphate oxidase family protein [Proteobacteria bacterium]|nr:pyridoxamine 5'-phosphate oxidase family protein [Pseudomonadota bacterium]
MTLEEIADEMKGIDFTMLSTRTEGDAIAARPMSNNGDVEYDGDSWFFAKADHRVVKDIEADPTVGLTLQGSKSLLGKPPIFIAIEGRAEVLRDRALFKAHWTKDIERWAEQGVDTPDLVLLKVHARRIHYWKGEDEGELTV